MELRDYQIQLIQDSRLSIRNGHRRICCVAPTGAGKTVIMSEIVRGVVAKGGTAWIAMNRTPLIEQTIDKLHSAGISAPIGFIKSGYPEDRTAPVQVCSIQSMTRRQWWRSHPPTVLLWDEAHESAFSAIGRQTILELFPKTIHLGFTATPCRLKKTEGMSQLFTDMVQGPLPAELQTMGHLVPMKYYAPETVDLSGVATVAGDYNEGQLSVRMNTPEMIAAALYHWERLSDRLPTLVFCVDTHHAVSVLGAFLEKGISAALVVGDTSKAERDRIFAEFAERRITVLVSIMVLSIGFDCPIATVGLDLRPTKSLALHLQKIGRVMRPHATKTHGRWIDLTGNTTNPRLRLPEDLQPWKLDEPGQPGEAPTKVCPVCSIVTHAAAAVCPECGHVFPVKEKFYAPPPATLTEIAPALTQSEAKRRDYFRQELRRAWREDALLGRATMRYKDRYGTWPNSTWKRGAIFDGNATNSDRALFLQWLWSKAHHTQRDRNWVEKQWRGEFGSALPTTITKESL